ncbi:GntR family transcriptional regulator [Butyrivibrio sp. AE2032]|uniref:GntR family transcriptional regulator n=1 Tax=Butyrivibrio sp. AE2032 TaxID=1458463 RepID=UPI000551FD64|nr:GntR family transcriptional regulator [Butyrivibrio sp. AE2032]
MAEKYTVVVNKLELELKRMRAEGKTKLPSEKELCSTFSCSRQTVRTALEILEAKGLIVKRRGSGSYLADDTARNMTVFYITDDCDRYQNPALISGLKTELAASGYELKTFSSSGRSSEEAAAIKRAIGERAAAVIIEPSRDLIPGPVTRLIEEAFDSRIPVIWCNAAYPPEGTFCVAPDYRRGGKKITDQFKENGRRKTACVFRMDSSQGREGYEGYIDSVFGTDLPFEDYGALLLTYDQEKEIISGRDEVLSAFLDKVSSYYDALVCQNGMLAHQAICLLRKKGISVPEDITIACFDSGCYYRDYGDGMTALGYDNGVLCKALAKTAVSLAEGRSAKDVTIPLKWME